MLVKLIVTLAQRFRQIYDSAETGLETKHHIPVISLKSDASTFAALIF